MAFFLGFNNGMYLRCDLRIILGIYLEFLSPLDNAFTLMRSSVFINVNVSRIFIIESKVFLRILRNESYQIVRVAFDFEIFIERSDFSWLIPYHFWTVTRIQYDVMWGNISPIRDNLFESGSNIQYLILIEPPGVFIILIMTFKLDNFSILE